MRNIYHKEYEGKIDIQKLDPIGYSVKIGLGMPPITMYAELDDEQFLKFIKEELRTKRLGHIFYGKLYLQYPTECYDE